MKCKCYRDFLHTLIKRGDIVDIKYLGYGFYYCEDIKKVLLESEFKLYFEVQQ
jgi:hypothetical protein